MYDIIMFVIAMICFLFMIWIAYTLYEKCKYAKTRADGLACVTTVVFTFVLTYMISVIFTNYAPEAAKSIELFINNML